MRGMWLITLSLLGVAFAGCTAETSEGSSIAFKPPGPQSGLDPIFRDVAVERGLAQRIGSTADPLRDEIHMMDTMAGGLAVADIDGDGDEDFVAVDDKGIRLWLWGGERFEEASQTWGVGQIRANIRAPLLADVDNDGDPDLVLGIIQAPSRIFENTGTTFVDRTAQSGLNVDASVHGVAAADIDNDGDLDLAFGNYMPWWRQDTEGYVPGEEHESNMVWFQTAPWTFTLSDDPELDHGAPTLAIGFSDIDRDGDQDLISANDFGFEDQVYRNDGQGRFLREELLSGGNGMGVLLYDLNTDTWPDLYISNIFEFGGSSEGSYMYLNSGGSFEFEPLARGAYDAGWSWGGAVFDADHDGDLDMAIPNGFHSARAEMPHNFMEPTQPGAEPPMMPASGAETPNRFFLNIGGRFVDAAEGYGLDLPVNGRGIVHFDYDNDGDEDLLHAAFGSNLLLMQNDAILGAPLRVELEGTQSNRDGVGTQVFVQVGDRTLMRERQAGAGYLSQPSGVLHFGLNGATSADIVHVAWPSGQTDTFRDVQAGHIVIREGEGIAHR